MGSTTLCRVTKDGFPMMSEKEVKIIDNLIEQYKPVKCLEWGSGNSTLYFPNKHQDISIWLSIEHNGHYLEYLKNKITNSVSIIYEDDEHNYINSCKYNMFDFILIDGLYREQCIEMALELITDDGIILLHDSGREEYQEIIKKYNGVKISDGEEEYKGYYKHRGLTVFKKTCVTLFTRFEFVEANNDPTIATAFLATTLDELLLYSALQRVIKSFVIGLALVLCFLRG